MLELDRQFALPLEFQSKYVSKEYDLGINESKIDAISEENPVFRWLNDAYEIECVRLESISPEITPNMLSIVRAETRVAVLFLIMVS